MLGLIPRKRWPAQDSTTEEATRRRLYDVLVVGTTPDERTAALIAVLAAVDEAHKLFDADRTERKAVKARAKSFAEGSWVAAAVKKAVQAAQAAASASTSATTAGG